jgi:hypothetical protein
MKLKVIYGAACAKQSDENAEKAKQIAEDAAKAAAARTIIRDDAARAIMENADVAQKVPSTQGLYR